MGQQNFFLLFKYSINFIFVDHNSFLNYEVKNAFIKPPRMHLALKFNLPGLHSIKFNWYTPPNVDLHWNINIHTMNRLHELLQ